jgi:hypothetical protein
MLVLNIANNIVKLIYDTFFHIRTVHLDILKVFYSPTEAQVNSLKRNVKVTLNPH